METGNRTYALEVQTPLGKRRGSLSFTAQGRTLTGELTLFTRTTPIQEGSLEDGRITFRGEMKMLVGMLPYQARGTLREKGLDMELSTPRGSYPVTGVQTRKRRG